MNNRLSLRIAIALVTVMASTLALAAGPRQLTGKVIDAASGQPLQNATVRLAELDKTTTTDAAGEFSFSEVASGGYHVEISANDYYPTSAPVQFSAEAGAIFEFTLNSRASLMSTNIVTVLGEEEPIKDTARSIGVVSGTEIRETKQVGLDEVLNAIPGVKAENQSGSEQVRVSIRGRDVRNSFGIIGIKLLVDGIPESDASGETPDITGIDMASADRIEVVKGPMSARYGASAAGIVNLISHEGAGPPEIDVTNYGGSYGFDRNQLNLDGSAGLFDYAVDGSRTVEDGYRDHSAFYAYRVNSRFGFRVRPSLKVNVFLKFNHSNDELPGPLTQQEYAADPSQVSFLYGLYNSSENIARAQGGFTIAKDFGDDRVLSGMVFSRVLDYTLPLPFIYLDGHRPETGASAKYTFQEHSSPVTQRFSFGVDYQHEEDFLKDFGDNPGGQTTFLEANQIRHVYNLGLYAFDELRFGKKLNVTAGVNYSRLNFNFFDALAGATSGSKLFNRVTYEVGAAYHFRPNISAYANVSSGLETPTLSELGIAPSGATGLNSTLKPELSTSYEVGGLFKLFDRASFNVALFRTLVDNEIVPTGVGSPQVSFDNAAKTAHNGLEAAMTVSLYRDLEWNVAYTYADFYYVNYLNLLGQNANSKQIPALPRNHVFSSLRYHNRQGLGGEIGYEFVGKMFADDLNSVVSPKYSTAYAHVSYSHSLVSKLGMKLLFGINNFNNANYVAYVVPNGTFGAYFYPAPARNYFGSLQLNWRFSGPQ